MIKFLFWEKCRFTYHCKKWSRKVLGTFHYFHFVIAQPGYWHQYRQGTECFSHCKEPSCSPHTHPAWVPSRSFSRKQQVFWKPKLEHVAPCLKPVNSFSLPSRQNHRSLAASPSLPICLPLPLALTLQFHKTSVQLCSLRCHSSSCKEALWPALLVLKSSAQRPSSRSPAAAPQRAIPTVWSQLHFPTYHVPICWMSSPVPTGLWASRGTASSHLCRVLDLTCCLAHTKAKVTAMPRMKPIADISQILTI